MTTHTDRIRQMAKEATAYADAMDGSGQMAGRIWSDVRDEYFAQLVAEDCARIADESEPRRGVGDEIRYEYSLKD